MIGKISEEELLSYRGMGCEPSDFDDYWKRAIDEMKAVEPKVEMKSVDLNFKGQECFEMYFTGVGGARIYCKYIRPKNAKNMPVVFRFHGYGGRSEGWYDFLPLVSQGYCVAAMDCRGQGGKSDDVSTVKGTTLRGHIVRGLENDGSDSLLYRQVFLDTAELVRIVEAFPEIDKNAMYVMGGSQGGGLSIACAALSPQIKKAVVYFPFLSDYKYAYINVEKAAAFGELVEYFKMFDPRHEKADKVFEKLGYIDIQNLAKYVKADVFMASGMKDDVVPIMTQFAMFNKLKTKKEYYVYMERGHEKLDDIDDMALEWLNR